MMFLVFLGFALVPCIVYAIIIMLEVPGMADERLGVLEELPDDVGEWKVDTDSEQARHASGQGLICETRIWIDTYRDLLNREKIFRQVRYLEPETGEVVRAEKDVRIKRRRVRKRS